MTMHAPGNDSQRVFTEFSPKAAILQARGLGSYLLSKWKQILLIALISGLAGAGRAYLKKPLYEAELTFTLDEGAEQNNSSSLADLGARLGLGTSTAAGGIFSSMTNIIELMQSRLLIEKTLKRTVEINGKKIVFADFFLDSLEYREKWMKGSRYNKLNFLAEKKEKQEELYQNRIITNIYKEITGKSLKIETKGKGTTILSVTCASENELFTKYFLEALIDEVSTFYVYTKTQRAKNNLEFIQQRTDSTRMAYNRALFGRASFADANINPSLRVAIVPGERQQTDVQLLSTSYTELVRSLEAAKTTLMRETPLIQLLDTPILPLQRTSSSPVSGFIMFAVLGAVLSVFYFVGRRVLQYIMKN
ncbi:MAG: hypothetical protein H7Y03_02705 [Chitinophagaceae bacterium]|nr:hypothetical protein [Chitinophagaceae bacterium]